MKGITKLWMTLLLLCVAGVANAATEYEVDQKFTSVAALDGQLFAIVNETDAKAIYNKDAQNLAYDTYTNAVAGAAYLWKLHSLAGEGDEKLENAYAIEAIKADGTSQSLWGHSPLYLNSGAEGGHDGCFVLGNGTQYGTDVLYGGAWEIEYDADKGFALKNVARGGYFAGVNPAPTGEDPIYWTFCTLKEIENTDPLAAEKDALAAAIAKGQMYNGLAYTEESFGALEFAIDAAEGLLANPESAEAESLRDAASNIYNAATALQLKEGFSNLTPEYFMIWDSPMKPARSSAFTGCAYELFTPSGLPFGDGNVGYLNFVNLLGYDKLFITYTEGTPRVMMNRDVDGGQWNSEESESHMIEFPKGDDAWSAKYFTNGDGVIIVDLNQIIADKGFATLNAIKGANWQTVTVTGLYLYGEAAAPAEDVLPIDIQFGAEYNSEAVASYAKEWTATKDGYTWTITNFNNNKNGWTSIKCGRKNYESVASIASPAINAEVANYVVSVTKASNVNAVTLTLMKGEEAVAVYDITDSFVPGEVNVAVDGQKGYSYVLTIDNASASANGSVEISKVTLYGAGQYAGPAHIANTAETAYTVGEAFSLIEAGEALTDVVFVKGVVSQVTGYNATYKSITYYISENGTTEENQLQCYSGKGIEGADFENDGEIEVGAKVIVTGNLKNYNGVYEFDSGNVLVSYEAPVKPVIADGTYYIYNVDTKKYLAAGANWSTHAIVNTAGLDYTLTFVDGKYTIDSQVSNGGEKHYLNGEWNDGTPMGWTFDEVMPGVYTISCDDGYLAAADDDLVYLQNGANYGQFWQLKTVADRWAEMTEATAANPVDATFLVKDPNFGRNDLRKAAWQGDDFTIGGDNTNMNAEKWGGNSQTFDIYQTVEAPNGLYRVTWNGFYRYNNTSDNTNEVAAAAHAEGTEEILSYVYLNDADYPLTSIADETAIATLGKMPFSQGDASAAFGMGLYEQSANVIVTDGTLTIGIRKIDHIGTDWTIWDNFRLSYLGEAIDINPDAPELKAPEGWTNLIINGTLAGDNVESFVAKEYPSQDLIGARIVEGAGFNNSRGLVVKAGDDTENPDAQAWDSQFWINLSKALPEGTILHVEFDYKASQYAKTSTQAHGVPGAYLHWAMMGDVNFTPEWQHFSADVEVSAAMAKGDNGNGSGEGLKSIAFNMQEEKSATDYFFDNFGVWAKLPEEIQGDWVDMLDNGDLEGYDNHNFYTSLYNREMFNSNINDGDGVDGSRGLKIEVDERVEYDWDNMFFVCLNDKVPAGTKFRVSFDYRADTPASVSTMAFAEPGNYIHWALLGDLEFGTDWQTFEYEGTITSDMSKDDNFQSAGFKLSTFAAANNYYFDNFVFQVLKEHVDVIPSVVYTYPEASSFNVDGGTMEFHVNFDMPVDTEQLHATLDNEELTVIADGAIVWLARQGGVDDLADGEHTIKLYNIYAEGWKNEEAFGYYEFTFTVGQINLDPEAKAEVILADNLWDATPQGGIPEGYVVNFNGEERNSESTYGSGPRMFVFAEGGDFTHGLYFREGYTQYGGEENYPLYLEAGKKYTINFKSAMWKDNGTTMNFNILTADEEYLVFEEVIKNNPNVNGSTAAVTDATNTTIAFTPEEDGNYILRWAVDGFNEVLLANPTVKYMTDDVNENVLAFFAALENAKQERDASADFMDNEEYGSLDYEINWAESEYQNFTNFNQFLEAAKELENVAYRMKEYRRLYQEYYPLAETMLALRQQYADTKFTQSYIYNYLIRCIDNYAPYGEILDQYNLGSLSNAYSDIKYVVNLVQDMFTEGASRITMTGYAVLKERVRQGAETMSTLGIDNENLLWYAENTLEEEEWLVDEMKQSIKKDIYKKLSKDDNTLFDPIIDEETGEEVTPAYNMNIFVENPNIYKWGYCDKDFSVPGWYYDNANVSTGWANYDSWEVPADAMFSNWGNFFEVAQAIGDLPAGTYTVKFAVGERQEDTYTDSYAYVWTSNEEYTASIDYIGQTFPGFSVNNGLVTIENVVVTDGWMQFGVLAESGSHLFFNEVQLLLTAPAPGYDYNDDGEVLLGDVNLNGEVTTADAVATVSIVLEDLNPTYRQFRAADVNFSGNITVSDVVGVVNIALNGYEQYAELSRSQSFDQEINYLIQDGNKIGLKNTTEFVAFQMDVTLTDGATLNNVSLNQRANGLNIRFSRLEGNTYRIMAFSMDKIAITDNEGELLSLDITGNQAVTLSNIEFTDTDARAYALGVNDATGINGIMAGDANTDYYTINGVKSDRMRKGMNVVKTADGKVRKMFVK